MQNRVHFTNFDDLGICSKGQSPEEFYIVYIWASLTLTFKDHTQKDESIFSIIYKGRILWDSSKSSRNSYYCSVLYNFVQCRLPLIKSKSRGSNASYRSPHFLYIYIYFFFFTMQEEEFWISIDLYRSSGLSRVLRMLWLSLVASECNIHHDILWIFIYILFYISGFTFLAWKVKRT